MDSARANLAATFVSAFVNAGFGQDKLVTAATEDEKVGTVGGDTLTCGGGMGGQVAEMWFVSAVRVSAIQARLPVWGQAGLVGSALRRAQRRVAGSQAAG